VNNVTELIERQGIFATMGIVGTPNNLAVRDQLNEQCIPQLFATTGASEWGAVDEFPWTMGSIVSYEAEAAIYANYIQQEFPDGATVGLLVMNNDFGRSYQDGFSKAIEGTDIEIVEEQFVEAAAPSVANEITTLASSDADVLMGFVSGAICPQMMANVAQASWEPMTFLSSTCSSVVSFFAPVDPAGDGGRHHLPQRSHRPRRTV
jgi:ABC-type branched-subunit amino acid transport system substrate-binding protein